MPAPYPGTLRRTDAHLHLGAAEEARALCGGAGGHGLDGTGPVQLPADAAHVCMHAEMRVREARCLYPVKRTYLCLQPPTCPTIRMSTLSRAGSTPGSSSAASSPSRPCSVSLSDSHASRGSSRLHHPSDTRDPPHDQWTARFCRCC